MNHRHPISIVLFLVLAALPAVHGRDLKVAVVDLQHLFKEYHRTNEAQTEINVQRAKIQKENNARLEQIKDLEAKLQDMRRDLEDPSISDRKKSELFQEFQQKTQEGVGMDKERREFLQRRNEALNEAMMERMRKILNEIREMVEKRGREKGYNLILDKSGLSTSQTPLVLFSDLADLTAGLLAELNKGA